MTERLVIPLSHIRFLFPSPILSDDDRSYVLSDSQPYDLGARFMKQVFDFSVSGSMQSIQSLGSMRSFMRLLAMTENAHKMSLSLIVVLIDRLDLLALHQYRS